jgi:hypothetical protein
MLETLRRRTAAAIKSVLRVESLIFQRKMFHQRIPLKLRLKWNHLIRLLRKKTLNHPKTNLKMQKSKKRKRWLL